MKQFLVSKFRMQWNRQKLFMVSIWKLRKAFQKRKRSQASQKRLSQSSEMFSYHFGALNLEIYGFGKLHAS